MSPTPTERGSRKDERKDPPGTDRRLSKALIVATLGCFAAGVALGLVAAVPNAPAPAHNPALNAWPAHIVVTVVVAAGLAGWVWWSRRNGGGAVDLLAPWRLSALRRLGRTAKALTRGGPLQRLIALLRTLVVLAIAALLLYLVFRIGFQITFTRGAAQTINAWGGPSYLGALYAHAIDAIAVALIALGVAHLAAEPLDPQRPPGRT